MTVRIVLIFKMTRNKTTSIFCDTAQENTNSYCYLIGHVTLNEHCMYNHQCSASPYAACLEGTCKCIDGYKAQNDGHCEKGIDARYIFCIFSFMF